MNWIEFLKNKFHDGKKYDLQHSVIDDELAYKVKLLGTKSDISIRFDIDKNQTTIMNRAVFSADGVRSFCEGAFNQNMVDHLEFVQKSWFDVNGDSYQLIYGDESTKELDNWLRIPILEGWIEAQYSFKKIFYRVDIFRNTVDASNCKTIYLKSSGEQDIPFGVFDEIIQKFRSIYLDQLSNKKYQRMERIEIH